MLFKRTTSKTEVMSIMFSGSPTRPTATWTKSTAYATNIAPMLSSSWSMTQRAAELRGRCAPMPIEAFAVVHHECATTSYTLAYVIGQLIGARQELAYANGTTWRDIMGSRETCAGCPRIPVWSSPTVLVKGEPAGTFTRDNAGLIAREAQRVAGFR